MPHNIYQNDISPNPLLCKCVFSCICLELCTIKVLGPKTGFWNCRYFFRSKTRDNINAKIKAYIKMKQHGWARTAGDCFESINLGGSSWWLTILEPDDTKNIKNTAWNCDGVLGSRLFHIASSICWCTLDVFWLWMPVVFVEAQLSWLVYCSINPLITPANHTSLDVRWDVCLEENRVKSHEKQGPTGMYDIVVLFRYYSCSASSLRKIEDVLRCVVVFVFFVGFLNARHPWIPWGIDTAPWLGG